MPIGEVTSTSLFAGIGGLSYALSNAARLAGCKHTIKLAVDVNVNCESVWKHNHPDKAGAFMRKSIDSSTKVEDFEADVWLVSPPCQPFTKGGKERHEEDTRAEPFLTLVQKLENCVNVLPQLIFLENVPHFGQSRSFVAFKRTTEAVGYKLMTWTKCPEAVSIPYTRNRFYCAAFKTSEAIDEKQVNFWINEYHRRVGGKTIAEIVQLSQLTDLEYDVAELEIAAAQKDKLRNFPFDLVHAGSTTMGVVTGGYARRAGWAGPVVLMPGQDHFKPKTTRFQTLPPGIRIRRLSPEVIRVFLCLAAFAGGSDALPSPLPTLHSGGEHCHSGEQHSDLTYTFRVDVISGLLYGCLMWLQGPVPTAL